MHCVCKWISPMQPGNNICGLFKSFNISLSFLSWLLRHSWNSFFLFGACVIFRHKMKCSKIRTLLSRHNLNFAKGVTIISIKVNMECFCEISALFKACQFDVTCAKFLRASKILYISYVVAIYDIVYLKNFQ